MGNYFSRAGILAKLYALLATLLPASPALAMPRLNGLPVMAIVMVMINVAVLGRVFRRICVIRALYSTRYRKAKESKGLMGSFGDRSWSRKAII